MGTKPSLHFSPISNFISNSLFCFHFSFSSSPAFLRFPVLVTSLSNWSLSLGFWINGSLRSVLSPLNNRYVIRSNERLGERRKGKGGNRIYAHNHCVMQHNLSVLTLAIVWIIATLLLVKADGQVVKVSLKSPLAEIFNVLICMLCLCHNGNYKN